jgi:thiamine pyrophosphokinase
MHVMSGRMEVFVVASFGLIVAAGAIDDYDAYRAMLGGLPAPGGVYCADGGLRHAAVLGLAPDIILGDMDSASPELLHKYREAGVPVERYPVEKDYTDTEFAVEYAVRDGCASILIIGAFGGRVDHSFANIQLSYKYARRGVRVVLADSRNAAAALAAGENMLIDKSYPIASLLGIGDIPNPAPSLCPKVSIFPIGGAARGVTTNGLKYALGAAELDSAYTTGVSNEFICRRASIEATEGAILVMVCAD